MIVCKDTNSIVQEGGILEGDGKLVRKRKISGYTAVNDMH